MKEPKRSYYYVGESKPTDELSRDSWGVKYLYLKDDKDLARMSVQSENEKRKRMGGKKWKVFRVSFVEVPR